MHMKKFRLLILIFLFSVYGDLLATTIVNFPLQSNNTPAASSSGNASCLLNTNTGGNVAFDTNTGMSSDNWASPVGLCWYTTAINTTDFYSITVTAQMKSDQTGPMDFKLQYSLDNSAWVDVSNLLPLTSTLASIGTFNLPVQCSFQPTIYIRFATYTLNAVDKTGEMWDFSALSYIKGLVVAGEQLAPPTTQASNISLVAITPTSIKIDCSAGTGTNRIIVMNTVNSFTAPANDYNPSANVNYNSGEQVVYNGTGTSVTVIVPSSKNEYWFRVYDYSVYSGKTRYITTTNVLNPKQCLLENVILPTFSAVKLTTATLGGTITAPASGTITERGIYWSTSPGVTVNSSKVIGGGTSTGVFTFSVTGLTRSTTIYFKAYVNNLSGTALSEEASFSNIPIYSGSGNWETAANWNVQQVPGSTGTGGFGSATDKPVINGSCIVTASNTCGNLTINSGKSLTINPAQLLNVSGTITNLAGTSGLIIKSSSSLANGAIMFRNASGSPVAGSVEMYSKANWNLANPSGNKYKWQFFGIPVTSLNAGNTFDFSKCYVREWDESVLDYNGVWVLRNDGSSLTLGTSSILSAGKGYEIVQQNPTTYTFAGNLVNSPISQTLTYSSGAAFAGQNILSNPFTTAINIKQITFGANTEAAVYLYNTGTFTDWSSSGGSSSPGNGPGQYTVSTPGTAGANSVPGQIPSMQAYLVKAILTNGSITIPYSATSMVANTDLQRTKAVENVDNISVSTRIDVVGTHFSDRMWIFTDPSCTNNFDNGWDGYKMLGASQVTQLYAIENDGNYQINAVNDMNGSDIGFQPGNDSQFKLIFNHENIATRYSTVYLVDLVANKTVDITASGTEYAFTATSSDVTKRFKIVAQPNIVNGLNSNYNSEQKLKVFNSEKAAFIQNFTGNNGHFTLIDLTGKIIQQATINSNGITNVSLTTLLQGTYIIKAETETEKVTQKLLIR